MNSNSSDTFFTTAILNVSNEKLFWCTLFPLVLVSETAVSRLSVVKYFVHLKASIQGDQSYCPPIEIKDADKLVGK